MRIRVSTTVDGDLLAEARRICAPGTDAQVLDQALRSLLARHRAVEIERSYERYDEQPLSEPDAWGDLASFREAAAGS